MENSEVAEIILANTFISIERIRQAFDFLIGENEQYTMFGDHYIVRVLRTNHGDLQLQIINTEIVGNHYQGDVRDILNDGWDLMIAHPPCTYLTNSGVRWLHEQEGRWGKMFEGAAFFHMLLNYDIPKIAVENPIPHKYAVELIGRKYDQIIHPWQFGHGEMKSTCLWLKDLSPLVPTNIVEGREQRIWKLPPGKDRWKLRSVTFQGIANAMAEQWV